MKKEVTNMMTVFGKDVPNPNYFEITPTIILKLKQYMDDRKKGISNPQIQVEN